MSTDELAVAVDKVAAVLDIDGELIVGSDTSPGVRRFSANDLRAYAQQLRDLNKGRSFVEMKILGFDPLDGKLCSLCRHDSSRHEKTAFVIENELITKCSECGCTTSVPYRFAGRP